MALVSGSPAIDAGDPSQIGQADQRGIVRGSASAGTGSASDIGAYELATIDVSADNKEITYGQSAPSLTYTVTSGPSGPLTGLLALITPETHAGSYAGDIGQGTLTVTGTTYLLDFTAGQYKIDPRAVIIDPTSGQSKIYGVADPTLTASAEAATSSTGLVNGNGLSGSLSYSGAGQYTGVGTYAFTLGSLTAGSNYTLSIEASTPTFAITPRPVTIDPTSGQSKVYGTTDPTLTYTTATATGTTGLVNGDLLAGDISYSGAGQYSNAGNHAFTLGNLSGSNYAVAIEPNPPTFAVNPASLTVTADNKSMTYGGTSPSLTYSYTGLLGNDTTASFIGALGRTGGNNAGTYSIVQNTFVAIGNYTIGNFIPGAFTINPPAAGPVATRQEMSPAPIIPGSVLRGAQDPSLAVFSGSVLSPSPPYPFPLITVDPSLQSTLNLPPEL